MIEPASDWLARNAVGLIGIIRGGGEADFFKWVTGTTQQKSTILATKSEAGDIQAQLVLQPGHAFVVRVSRGIERDIQDAIRERSRRHLVFSGKVTKQFFATKAKMLGQRLAVLTGYDHPPALVREIAKQRLLALFEQYAQERCPSILIHDPELQMSDVQADYACVAELEDAGPRRNEEWPYADPPIGAVHEHIEFLARTDTHILDQMHDFLATHPSAALTSYWRTQLQRADIDLGYTSLRALALDQLTRLEKKFLSITKD
jgi:hypothetical protein